MTSLYPLRLLPSFRERIWGSHDLSPFFGKQERRIGEAWYSFDENVIANGPLQGRTLGELMADCGRELLGESALALAAKRRAVSNAPRSGRSPVSPGPFTRSFPILAKLLFTSDRLSVQVHPKDAYAWANENSPGKTEMWYVAAAEPGARVALGLNRTLSRDGLRKAAVSGEIESCLNWVEVRAGQSIFVPAGTLHTVGPGLVLCEIQQNSDVTYRLFDFGRLGADGKPRELHIAKAVEVAERQPHSGSIEPFRFPRAGWTRELLVACPCFAVEHWGWGRKFEYHGHPDHANLLIFLQGEGTVADQPYVPGDAYLIPAGLQSFDLSPESPAKAIRAFLPNLDVVRNELAAAGYGVRTWPRLLP